MHRGTHSVNQNITFHISNKWELITMSQCCQQTVRFLSGFPPSFRRSTVNSELLKDPPRVQMFAPVGVGRSPSLWRNVASEHSATPLLQHTGHFHMKCSMKQCHNLHREIGELFTEKRAWNILKPASSSRETEVKRLSAQQCCSAAFSHDDKAIR